MPRILIMLFALSFLAPSVGAQEAETEAEPTEDAEEVEEPEVEEEIDETNLDDQGFTDVDNDFRPSEDIPADQSIPFPSDI